MYDLLDHLGTLNDLTPRIKVGSDHPVRPDIIFGLDTKLFLRVGEEKVDWEKMGGEGKHEDEVEVRSLRRGGREGKRKGKGHDHGPKHEQGEGCGVCRDDREQVDDAGGEVEPIEREVLEKALSELSFEVYRGELVHLYLAEIFS